MLRPFVPTTFLFMLSATASADPCTQPVTASDLAVTLDAAETAFADADADAFVSARDEAQLLLLCGSGLAPDLQARVYLIEAFFLFGQGEEDEARASLIRYRELRPDAQQLPRNLVPEGHPLVAMFDEAVPTKPPPMERARRPVVGITVAGVGVGLAAVGVADLAAGGRAWRRYLETPSNEEAETIWSSELAPRQKRVPALLTAGGVVLGTGLVLVGTF